MRFSVWIVLVLFSFPAFSQSTHYNFSRLNTYNGLSHNQINTIFKDPDGFLWFGTQAGLNRYDGYSFKVFNKILNDSTSLFDNSVLSLYELPDGKMWVDTRGGACIYDPHTEKFDANFNNYLKSLGLPSAPVIDIVKVNNGRYWFLYDSLNLYLYSATDKKAKAILQSSASRQSEKITSVSETKEGKLWLAYQNGLLQEYDVNANKVVF